MMSYAYWRDFIPKGAFKRLEVDDIAYVPVPDGGDCPDIIDERYIEAYRLMGNMAFTLMIVGTSDITPERASEMARMYVKAKNE